MKKIVTVIGARPQFIKAATLSRQFQLLGINEVIIHTGQHFDTNMSDVFFEEMEIPQPSYNFNINGISHGAMTGRMLEEVEKILQLEKPDALLVYGDTNSTLAGALAAAKLQIPVIHVEAGLRSYNMSMPEEINRILTDRISNILFCPTDEAVNNLHKEGFADMPIKIYKSGDVMQDAAIYYAQKADEKSRIIDDLCLDKFILATIHRQENTDNPDNLAGIVQGLNLINKITPVIIPIHPRTKKILSTVKIQPEFKMIDPIGYFDMIMLLKNCEMVFTDSGGVQKEAFFFKKQCITLREQTEWVELVENGYNTLVGSNKDSIFSAFQRSSNNCVNFSLNLYGNGNAARTIAEIIYQS